MINLSRPSIRRRDMDAVLSCMVTDSLGPGSLCDQLVSSLCEYLGLAGGIALRERSRAFSIAIDLLELEAGARVALDPLVPHAYHEVLATRRIEAVYVDVAEGSPCIDTGALERLFASDETRPDAIVTHTALGFVPDMEALVSLGVPLIEDVSEGMGANTGEERVGRFGRFVIAGMEPDDVITAGGGTVLLAASRTDRTSLGRLAGELSSDALLPDMNAALGLTQIREIEKFIARRAEIAAIYAKAILRGRHRTPVQPGDAQNVFLNFPVVVEGSVADVVAYAKKKGVEAAQAFRSVALARFGVTDRDPAGEAAPTSVAGPASVAPPPIPESDLPRARSLLLRCLEFPLYPSLTSKEVASIERVLTTLP